MATERRNPSTPSRAAASSGESVSAGAREIVTTRPLGARRRSVAESAMTGADASCGRSIPLSTTTTAPQRVVSSGVWRTSRSQPSRASATRSASSRTPGVPPSTSTGPTVSGSPARKRRRTAGRGRPSFLASVFVKPELTAWT
ncbi:Uncharacterised protein [Mycobacteroides abscessus]|nr:Uncharacterised protein [Mycobacteroides abscessus]